MTRSPLAPLRSTRPDEGDQDEVLSVADCVARLRGTLRALGAVVVEGEVSAAKVAPNGHVYFTLKDERAEAAVPCVMWASDARRAGGERIVNGARVQVRATVEVYAPQGKLQLMASRITPAGLGDLLVKREALKRKLASEGLFDPARKRPLPPSPRVVGLVTSKNGAALGDVTKVARRRGRVRILLAPATVQGDDAARQMRWALYRLSQIDEVDVIILARGGGSAEDLSAFDDEKLARMIAECPKPVVAAIGHEVDWSIACHVADVRAATPSQAAEIVVPDERARIATLDEALRRLSLAMRARLKRDHAIVARAMARVRAPERAIGEDKRRLAELEARMTRALRARVRSGARARDALDRALQAKHPRAVIDGARASIAREELRLQHAARGAIERRRASLATMARALDAISPLAVLSRGYAIAMEDGRALRSASEVSVGASIEVRLAEGALEATVTKTRGDR